MGAAQELENLQEKMNWHWRNSMRVVRFGPFDVRASLPMPILLVYFRWSTLFLTILFLMVFRYLERKGLTFPAAVRNFRSWIIGKDRPGWLGVRTKKFVDYG
ncbi:MAG: type IV secretion protein IcmT [Alphaproteobacteria bacterium]|nr:type IV secretion protein IcmT [Alphaproteobacteria bacterium]